MSDDSLLLDLECPCPEFGSDTPSTAQQLLALMAWLGVVSAKHGDIAALVQMAVDNGLTAQDISSTLNISLATAYRLMTRNKAWLAQARQLESTVRDSRRGVIDIFAMPLNTILLSRRVRDTLMRGSHDRKQMLTLARFRDHWSFEYLQRIPRLDLVGMENLAKCLTLAGLGDDFECLVSKIRRATRRQRAFAKVECTLPEEAITAPVQRQMAASGLPLEFISRAAAVQRDFAWGSMGAQAVVR